MFKWHKNSDKVLHMCDIDLKKSNWTLMSYSYAQGQQRAFSFICLFFPENWYKLKQIYKFTLP